MIGIMQGDTSLKQLEDRVSLFASSLLFFLSFSLSIVISFDLIYVYHNIYIYIRVGTDRRS